MTRIPVPSRKRVQSGHPSDRGTALIMAVSMLALFAVLGTAYLKFATIENERAMQQLREVRVQNVAVAGMSAGIGALQSALRSGQIDAVLNTERVFEFPVYDSNRIEAGVTLLVQDERRAAARVRIEDECSKVNLNHVPASVLQQVLGVDGATARRITGNLPRAGGVFAPQSGDAEKGWLLSVDDLLARGLLSQEQFDQVNTDLVTTLSVANHEAPSAYLNVNSAPPEVMAAILDVSVDDAAAIIEKRPFDSLASLSAAAGKAPETFNIRPDPASPEALPASLAFESRCYRLRSNGSYASLNPAGKEYNRATQYAEAVILLDDAAGYETLYWATASRAEGQEAAVEEVDLEDTADVETATGTEVDDASGDAPPVEEEADAEETSEAADAEPAATAPAEDQRENRNRRRQRD